MWSKWIVILGAGGYGRTIADVAAQTGAYEKILFLDDNSLADDVIGKCAVFSVHADENSIIRLSETTKVGYRG